MRIKRYKPSTGLIPFLLHIDKVILNIVKR